MKGKKVNLTVAGLALMAALLLPVSALALDPQHRHGDNNGRTERRHDRLHDRIDRRHDRFHDRFGDRNKQAASFVLSRSETGPPRFS